MNQNQNKLMDCIKKTGRKLYLGELGLIPDISNLIFQYISKLRWYEFSNILPVTVFANEMIRKHTHVQAYTKTGAIRFIKQIIRIYYTPLYQTIGSAAYTINEFNYPVFHELELDSCKNLEELNKHRKFWAKIVYWAKLPNRSTYKIRNSKSNNFESVRSDKFNIPNKLKIGLGQSDKYRILNSEFEPYVFDPDVYYPALIKQILTQPDFRNLNYIPEKYLTPNAIVSICKKFPKLIQEIPKYLLDEQIIYELVKLDISDCYIDKYYLTFPPLERVFQETGRIPTIFYSRLDLLTELAEKSQEAYEQIISNWAINLKDLAKLSEKIPERFISIDLREIEEDLAGKLKHSDGWKISRIYGLINSLPADIVIKLIQRYPPLITKTKKEFIQALPYKFIIEFESYSPELKLWAQKQLIVSNKKPIDKQIQESNSIKCLIS